MPHARRIEPRPGQESVGDYPRPPRVEESRKHVQVVFGGVVIAESRRAQRVLETSHPPVYYLPPEDVRLAEYFTLSPSRTTCCEWKGLAAYYTIRVGDCTAPDAAWTYPDPTTAFQAIRGYIAVYPGRMEACYVEGERVRAQPGDFYGGWITRDIVGPFKGAAGTMGW
jgi:uncharacterized protein (DUF427 family)